MTRAALDQLNLGSKTFGQLAQDGLINVSGDAGALQSFFGLLDEFEFWFEIVRP